MVQSYLVGVFFAIGLVSGIVLSLLVIESAVQSSIGPLKHRLSATLRPLLQNRDYVNSTDSVYMGHAPMSHDEVNSIPGRVGPMTFQDQHKHHDDDAAARALYSKVRVLCWVMTTGSNHKSKAVHVKATWGKRCNTLLFMSDTDDEDLPAVKLHAGLGREHLTAKTMQAFDMIHSKYLEDHDWFIKADDDTYIIVENLRYMLSAQSPDDPVYFGHHFKVIVKQGYFSGGGGYAVSREALRRFGGRAPDACARDNGAEDVAFGSCMQSLGVVTGDSRDVLGRSRFHCFNPETFIHGGYPDWYLSYDKYGAQKGIESVSDYAVTFHYISTNQMYELEFYVYHLRPYGIHTLQQNLNGRPQNVTTPAIQDKHKS